MLEVKIEKAKNGFIVFCPSDDKDLPDETLVVEFEDDWGEINKFFRDLVPLLMDALGVSYFEGGRRKYSKRGFEIMELERKSIEEDFKEKEVLE